MFNWFKKKELPTPTPVLKRETLTPRMSDMPVLRKNKRTAITDEDKELAKENPNEWQTVEQMHESIKRIPALLYKGAKFVSKEVLIGYSEPWKWDDRLNIDWYKPSHYDYAGNLVCFHNRTQLRKVVGK